MIKDLEIISVNYNTPDLIEILIKSIIEFEGLYPIRIIDGSDKEPYISEIKTIANKYHNVSLHQFNYNIHHGKGLDYGLSTCECSWALIMDSDMSLIKNGLFGELQFSHFYEGFAEYVTRSGTNVKKDFDGALTYLHPRFLLVDVGKYNKSRFKFIHHGAPAIAIMDNLNDGFKRCIPDEYREYIHTDGRGTAKRFGYNL